MKVNIPDHRSYIGFVFFSHALPSHQKMDVSENSGTPKSSILNHFNRVVHYKPSILGYPYFWKHPNDLRRRSFVMLPCPSTKPCSCHTTIGKRWPPFSCPRILSGEGLPVCPVNFGWRFPIKGWRFGGESLFGEVVISGDT